MTLIRLCGSESSLGAHSLCLFCYVAAHILFDPFRLNSVLWFCSIKNPSAKGSNWLHRDLDTEKTDFSQTWLSFFFHQVNNKNSTKN